MKSTVAIMCPYGEIIASPFEITHTEEDFKKLTSQIQEYPAALSVHGVGTTLGPQLIAEIGDVRRFHNRKALIAYRHRFTPLSIWYYRYQKSWNFQTRIRFTTNTLFAVRYSILRHKHTDEPVYQFPDKKCTEEKHYYVYMIAGCNKFFRIYFARVSEYLNLLGKIILFNNPLYSKLAYSGSLFYVCKTVK